jgi:site-specific recombinase XerD
MARPVKDPEKRQKMDISQDIINQLSYNGNLSQEQIEDLKQTLTSTLNQYNIQKDESAEIDIRDRNMNTLEEFLASKRVEAKSNNTIYNYGNEISKMYQVLNKPYEEITSADIRRYMDYRKQHDGLKTVTISNIRMYLMSYFKWMVQEEYITKSPMDKIAPVKVEQHIIETLTDEEAEMIRCACSNERDLAIIDLLSSSGMRVSELTGLNITDVDFETGEVKVFGKGSKERICFLTGRAKVHLKWYLAQRTDDNPALFVTAKKPYSRLTKNGVEFILKNIAKNSQVPRVRLYPHKYRSTLATNMINKGASIDKVQHILGHQNCDTTIHCYARMDKSTIKNAHHTFVA